MFWLMDQNHPMHFVLIAEVVGRTEIGQWQEAHDNLCQQLPLVWSRILSDDTGEPHFRKSVAGAIPLEVVYHAPTDWTAIAAAQLARPFDPSQAPLMRAALVYGVERSTIILCAHHSIADGLSLTYFFRDLLRAVAGETVILKQEGSDLEHLVERRFAATGAPSQSSSADGRPVSRALTPYRKSNGSRPYMEPLRFTRKATAQLRDRARTEGCSIHGALCAAFVSAHSNLTPTEPGLPLRVSSPGDIRRRLLEYSDHFGLCICGVGQTAPGFCRTVLVPPLGQRLKNESSVL
jgi:hypothetical protein